MIRKIHYLCSILACVATLPACAASPLYYSADAIEAQVIDAETKQPLEGVIVTANWQLFHSTVGGRVPGDQLMVLEAVTAKDGKFTFFAWGPKLALSGYLDNRDPQLLLFKPGYEYKRLMNQVSSKTNMASVRRSQWNGKTIELKKFKGTIQAYEDHFESLNNDLEHIAADNPEECGWRKIPDTIRAMNRERNRLVALGVNPNTLSSIDNELSMNDQFYTKKGGCGSPKEFFGGFKQ